MIALSAIDWAAAISTQIFWPFFMALLWPRHDRRLLSPDPPPRSRKGNPQKRGGEEKGPRDLLPCQTITDILAEKIAQGRDLPFFSSRRGP